MPTIVLGGSGEGGERPVVVPGRERVALAELVALARAGQVRLPFDVAAVEAALAESSADDDAGDAGAEARRAWHERLSPGTPVPEDEVALLLAEQAAQVRATRTDAERAELRATMTEALRVLAGADVLLRVELGLRLGAGAPDGARAWVGVRGEGAVSLATVSGATFELAWASARALPEMLAHLVRLPAAEPADADEVPDAFTVPVELLAAEGAGTARQREELLPALVERFPGAVTGADGEPYAAAESLALLHTVRERLTARLRVVVAGAPGAQDDVPVSRAGVVVWMRLGDQWFALTPDRVAGVPVGRASAVEPGDLAAAVGPVLARVWGRGR